MAQITIQISDRIENELRARIGETGDDLSAVVVDLIEKGLATPESDDAGTLTDDQWSAKFRAWAACRPAYGVVADFSRESIYEGRGE